MHYLVTLIAALLLQGITQTVSNTLPVFLPSLPLATGERWITDTDLALDDPMRPYVDAVYVDPSPDLADLPVCTEEMLASAEASDTQSVLCKMKMFRVRRERGSPFSDPSAVRATPPEEVSPSSTNAATGISAANILSCPVPDYGCSDLQGLRGVQFHARGSIPTTDSQPLSNYYYAIRTEIGSNTSLSSYTCGGVLTYPKLIAGSMFGRYGTIFESRPYTQIYCAAEGNGYVSYTAAVAVDVYQGALYKIVQTVAGPGTRDSTWRSYYSTSGVWVVMATGTFTNKFRDAQYLNSGFDIVNIISNVFDIHLQTSTLDKINVSGYWWVDNSPWDEYSWASHWQNHTHGYYHPSINVRSCDEDVSWKRNWTSLTIEYNITGGGISSCPGY